MSPISTPARSAGPPAASEVTSRPLWPAASAAPPASAQRHRLGADAEPGPGDAAVGEQRVDDARDGRRRHDDAVAARQRGRRDADHRAATRRRPARPTSRRRRRRRAGSGGRSMPPSQVCHAPPTRLTMPALAIASPSPLRPTAIAAWPARSRAASPSGERREGAPSVRRGETARCRSPSRCRRASPRALLPLGADQRAAAGVRRKTCAAVTTRPGAPDHRRRQDVPRRPSTAKVAAPTARRARRCGRSGQRSGSAARVGFGSAHAGVTCDRCEARPKIRACRRRRIRRTAERTCAELGRCARPDLQGPTGGREAPAVGSVTPIGSR